MEPTFHNSVESIILIGKSLTFLASGYLMEPVFEKMINKKEISVSMDCGGFTELVRENKLNKILGEQCDINIRGLHNVFDRKGYILKRYNTILRLSDTDAKERAGLNGKDMTNLKFEVLGWEVVFI